MKLPTGNKTIIPIIAVIAISAVLQHAVHADETKPALTAAGKNPPQSYFDKQKAALRTALSK